jgi:hypothetical protein
VVQAHVLRYLVEHPCTDCGEHDPVVLEFDHVGEKTATIARLVSDGAELGILADEISRCEVVCVNCHRRRTARRASAARNFAHLEAILRRSGCLDCGERDRLVLEFDHVGPKHAKVTSLAWFGCSLETIDDEIAHCEVRCANRHRRVTAQRGGHYRVRSA